MFICVCAYVCMLSCIWRLEDTLQESVLSFTCVGGWDQIQVKGLASRHHYLLSCLVSPDQRRLYKNLAFKSNAPHKYIY